MIDLLYVFICLVDILVPPLARKIDRCSRRLPLAASPKEKWIIGAVRMNEQCSALCSVGTLCGKGDSRRCRPLLPSIDLFSAASHRSILS
jgi:hypothetical protein